MRPLDTLDLTCLSRFYVFAVTFSSSVLQLDDGIVHPTLPRYGTDLTMRAFVMGGEFLTRATIWVTIVAYAIGSVSFAVAGKRSRWDAFARVAWTVAVISLIAHFICAFHFYHGWSHDAAYRDTARQTEEVVCISWGGGLFINYAFLIIWIADIAWWWLDGLDSYRARPWPLIIIWHTLLILIIFNATVVFEDGIVRWVGLAICLSLCLTWIRAAKQRSTRTQGALERD